MPAPFLSTRPLLAVLTAGMVAFAQQSAAQSVVQDAPAVSGVTVTGGIAPVPQVGKGAPQFTVEELSQVVEQADDARVFHQDVETTLTDCYHHAYDDEPPLIRLEADRDAYDLAMRLEDAATAAEKATLAAIDLRRRFPLGEVTQEALEAGELKRQAAVNAMLAIQAKLIEAKAAAIETGRLAHMQVPVAQWESAIQAEISYRRNAAAEKAVTPTPKEFADLGVEGVVARLAHDGKGDFLRVTGKVHNTRDKAIPQPPLAFTAYDSMGFVLVSETAQGKGHIAPGESVPFAYELRPSPGRTKTVEVTFGGAEGPPWSFPASMDPACGADPPEDMTPQMTGRSRIGRRGQ